MSINEILSFLAQNEDFKNLTSYDEFDSDSFQDLFGLVDEDSCYIYDNLKYAYGMTKCVFIPKNENFVIKIPFTGEIDENGFFCFFQGAGDYEWNYCEQELEMYKLAKEHKVEKAFAKISYIYNLEFGLPIYKQEKATFKTCNSPLSDEELDTVTKSCFESGCKVFNTNWLKDAYNYYSKDFYYSLIDFLATYEIDQDLHCDNLGYIGDRPVIIDYSGYYH